MRIDSPISSNAQITGSFTGSFKGDGSQLTGIEHPSVPAGVVSGSSQIVISDTTGYSTLAADVTTNATNISSVDGRVTSVEGDVAAILASSTADKDSFAEIVSLINSVDTENDTAFGAYVTSNNTAVAANTSKLAGIESGATGDMTAAEIKAAYESNADTNEFSDAEQSKLAGIEAGATNDTAELGTLSGRVTDVEAEAAANTLAIQNLDNTYASDADVTSLSAAVAVNTSKLDGVEAGATADMTPGEILAAIKTVDGAGSGLDADLLDGQSSAYYATATSVAANTSKLNGIEPGASADMTPGEILAAIKTVDGAGSGLDADLLDGQSSAYFGTAEAVAANTSKVGITPVQADAIAANTAKVGITSGQAEAIVANTAKVGITSGQAEAIVANSAKVGITSAQADAIADNASAIGIINAKDPVLTVTGDATGTATFTNLGNASMTLTVADDSHNHVISNVDGLQIALDSKQSAGSYVTTTSAQALHSTDALRLSGNSLQLHKANGTNESIDLSAYLDEDSRSISSGTLNSITGMVTFTRDDASTFTLDLGDLLDDTNLVTSVAGKSGVVVLNASDISGLGALATLSTVNAATITDNSVGAAELNVSGNGTTAQFLRSDGDGTFSWVTPTDTNTQLSDAQVRSKFSGAGSISYNSTTGLFTGTDTNTQLSDSDIAAFGYIKTYTDTNTQLSDAQVRSKFSGAGSISYNSSTGVITGTDTNTQLSDSDIAAFGYIKTYTDTNTTYSAGSGLGLSGTTFSHSDTSTQGSVNNSGRTYIQDITLDGFGHVTGIASATETVVNTDTNTTYSAGSGIGLSGTSFSVAAGNGLSQTSTGLQMSGTYTGNFAATGNITAYSDARLKKDVKTIEGALDKTKALRGVEFTRIADDHKSIGVIAQELEAVLPELVLTDDEGMKSVNYAQITGLLIEAVKELSAKVDELSK